ncbi:MAG: alpha/beta hydrolase [Nanoarchaeota archaeon]
MIWYKTIKGNSSPIIFLHGAGSNHTIWIPYLKQFQRRTVILIDLPGHGNSQQVKYESLNQATLEVQKVMEKENALGAIVIGQSLGAVIASKLTFSAGRRISKIIMIGPFSKGLVKRQWFWENLATATNAVVSEPKSTKPVQDYADLFNSSMIKHPYTDLKGTHLHTYALAIKDLLSHSIDWPAIKKPCTVIIGTKDSLVSEKALRTGLIGSRHNLELIPCHHLVVTHAYDFLADKLARSAR